MRRTHWLLAVVVVFLPLLLQAQGHNMVFAAGTPEDNALAAISEEKDEQKKVAMYEDFTQKFSSNPSAVAFGNWQISQHYQNAGDIAKALDYGDKALVAVPDNIDLLVSQANMAQQLKNGAKTFDYAVRGADVCRSVAKQAKDAKPAAEGEQDAAAPDDAVVKSQYEFMDAAAYNVIVSETDAKARMAYIERFTPAFPDSKYSESVVSFAMVALSELKDMGRLVSYGEKALVANPNSLPTLLLLANAYSEDPKPGSTAKSVTYAQKAIAVAKADAPDADNSRKLSAGVAHSTLGYAYMKQEKTPAAIPELKAASALLKGKDDQSYALAAYRLGYAYAKLGQTTEARAVLTESVRISGAGAGAHAGTAGKSERSARQREVSPTSPVPRKAVAPWTLNSGRVAGLPLRPPPWPAQHTGAPVPPCLAGWR